MQRRGARGQPAKGERTARPKARKAPAAQVSTAKLHEQVDALTRELKEACEQQTATSDVLKVISLSTFDLEAVFQTLIESAARLCRAQKAGFWRVRDGKFQSVAVFGFEQDYLDYVQAHPIKLDRSSIGARAVLDRAIVHVHDVLADPEFTLFENQRLGNFRTALGVPLMREGIAIGAMFLSRSTVDPFTQQQIDLVMTFAAQAVIAIENTRLLSELRESLQQQTATADVLKVISRSAFNLQTVLDTLVESAVRLCEADSGVLRTREGDIYPVAATYRLTEQQRDRFTRYSTKPDRGSLFGRAILEGRTIHVSDVLADPEYDSSRLQDLVTVRAGLAVPMLREGTVVGVVTLQRKEPRPFTDSQIQLVTTFADQAVIAIENVRLFDEVQARTRELSESLEQQTATSEVLKVISSSPGELEPVFQAILANATGICGAKFGVLFRYENDAFRAAAMLNAPQALVEFHRQRGSFKPPSGTPLDRLLKAGGAIYTADEAAESNPGAPARFGGARSLVTVPMRKENKLVGAIIIYRQEVRPFTDKQIELLTNFAAQAVIAIENTRLLNELRESLQQQTAASEVLGLISSSPGELAPVF